MLDFEAIAKIEPKEQQRILDEYVDDRIRMFLRDNLGLIHHQGSGWTAGNIELALSGGDVEDNEFGREYEVLGEPISRYELNDCMESN